LKNWSRYQHEGWHLDRIKGSHHIFVKGALTIALPVHKGIVKKRIFKERDFRKVRLGGKIWEKIRRKPKRELKNI